jgi:hypothetical protein
MSVVVWALIVPRGDEEEEERSVREEKGKRISTPDSPVLDRFS